MSTKLATDQFELVRYAGKEKVWRAYKAHAAVWSNCGRNVMISAPTKEALELVWRQIVLAELDRDMVQEVLVLNAAQALEVLPLNVSPISQEAKQ